MGRIVKMARLNALARLVARLVARLNRSHTKASGQLARLAGLFQEFPGIQKTGSKTMAAFFLSLLFPTTLSNESGQSGHSLFKSVMAVL